MRHLILTFAMLSTGATQAVEQLDTFRSVVSNSTRSISAVAALPLPDGDVVTVVHFSGDPKQCPSARCVEINRHAPDGTLRGTRVKAVAMTSVTAAAVDALGRILVIGESATAGADGVDFGVMRLQADGSDDPSFTGGTARSPFIGQITVAFNAGQSNNDKPTALKIDAAGDIVIVGSVERSSVDDLDFGIVRLLGSDGSLDPRFGSGGKSLVSFNLGPESQFDIPYSVAISGSGDIVIGGIANDSAMAVDNGWVLGHRPVLARLNSKGMLDTGLCASVCNRNPYPAINQGRRVYYFGDELPHSDYISAVDVAGNGDIVAAGTSYTNGSLFPQAAIARFSESGEQLAERLEPATDDYARYMDVKFANSSGTRIIAAGHSSLHKDGLPTGYFMVQSFTAMLEYETGYGNCLSDNSAICFMGTDNTDYGNDVAESVQLDAQGRPLFAGTFRNPENQNLGSALFQRITNNQGSVRRP